MTLKDKLKESIPRHAPNSARDTGAEIAVLFNLSKVLRPFWIHQGLKQGTERHSQTQMSFYTHEIYLLLPFVSKYFSFQLFISDKSQVLIIFVVRKLEKI